MPNQHSVAKKVTQALAGFAPYSNGIYVDEESIWNRDGFWHVPVRRSAEATQTYEYYIILADAEQSLEDAGLDVMLVPSGTDLGPDEPREVSSAHLNGAPATTGSASVNEDEGAKREVLNAIRLRLADHPLDNSRIEVLESGLRRSNGWWQVPVRPEKNPPRVYLLYEALSQTETDLKALDGLDVLLVPAPAEDRTLN